MPFASISPPGRQSAAALRVNSWFSLPNDPALPRPRHRLPGRADHWIEIRFVTVLVRRHVLREQLSVDFDDNSVHLAIRAACSRLLLPISNQPAQPESLLNSLVSRYISTVV